MWATLTGGPQLPLFTVDAHIIGYCAQEELPRMAQWRYTTAPYLLM